MEEAAFARGIAAEALMDEAAAGIARAVRRFFPQPAHCLVFAGKGNNAGDAFAAAELLRQGGWSIDLHLCFPEEELGALARKKFRACGRREQLADTPLVILDGLLGLGARPPLREPIRAACREINRLRRAADAFVVAVDLPTGLDGDSGQADEESVVADLTVTIGAAKRGLLADAALNFVGRLELAPLAEISPNESCREIIATPATLRALLPRRPFGAYKNQFGRVGIVAGSRGLTGAAILCASGALRGGAGLVELFAPEDIYPILAAVAPPEVMVKPVRDYSSLREEPIDVWAVGPGLGHAHADEVLALIAQAQQPMVVDADGLNILAQQMSALRDARGPRLLTPHPGEMARLFPQENIGRAEHARRFIAQYPATLLLKGSRTIVAQRDHPLSYNTTGHPGMATGGMGDVLTGVCAALLAQNLSPFDAARLGAWVCGRAAEQAIFQGDASAQSLLPTDLLAHLGRAFRELSATAR